MAVHLEPYPLSRLQNCLVALGYPGPIEQLDERTRAMIQLSSSYKIYRDREYSVDDDPREPDDIPLSPDRHWFGFGLTGNLTYRIATPTSLSVVGSWIYTESGNPGAGRDERDRRFNLTAGINHYIF